MLREKKVYPLADGLSTQDTYAVLGSAEKFKKRKHAWKAWKTLKEFGCVAYPVAEGLTRLEGSKVYSNLTELKGKISVVVPCLLPDMLTSLVNDAVSAECPKIWFQEQTWSRELQNECDSAGLMVVRGCVLRHKSYPSKVSLKYLSPCYWHGLRDPKVPKKTIGR